MQVGLGKINKLYFRDSGLLFSNGAYRDKASRPGEESSGSSKLLFCKYFYEESFAHSREIRGFENPLKRGLWSGPKINNSPSSGAFGRTSAF
jgi:hypothetical protein